MTLALRATACLAVGVTALAGCLSVPDGPTPECHSTDDCDRAHGEVCEENVCWGNPPAGLFAAVISPPSSRHDLVSRELPQVVIPDFGWMGDLALEAPVLLGGKVVAACTTLVPCDPTPIAATITVSRRSQFQGGPGFKTVVNVDAGDAFSIPVPRTRTNDDPYTVTILPDATQKAGVRSAAELVPPRRMQVSVTDNTSAAPVPLGRPGLPVIRGTLTDSLGRGLAGYRVSALGRWDPTAQPTEVSTVAYTDALGGYAVTLSDELAGPVELVARPVSPPDKPVVAPTVHVGNLDATQSSQHDIMLPGSLGGPVELAVVVQGPDSGGTVAPVAGAHVSVAGVVTAGATSFTMADDQVSDSMGRVKLHLLNGDGIAAQYQLSITPPAGSTLGVVFEQQLPSLAGLASYAPPPIRLVGRVKLSGRVVDVGGKPLRNAAVTARPSLRFLWGLEPGPQAFVATIPAATTVTAESGEFVLWVDLAVPGVSESWGDYDLLIEPPTSSGAPTIRSEFAIPRSSALEATTVPDIVLPDAAHVHGRITGADGKSVEDAELKLYQVSTQLTLCSEVPHAPASCPIPAQLRARNTSDSEGTVRLLLPRL
jgi:protocatechuate 3,4-dioxygenase beta subunit